MPNTFGRPYTLGVSTAQSFPLVDPRVPLAGRLRYRRDTIPELAYANSLYVPNGRTPARGWILLSADDYGKLQSSGGLYGTNYQLQFDQFDPAAPAITFSNLAIVQARCVTAGMIGDKNAIYLIELTDARGVLASRWFHQPITAYYNVRAPAYPQGSYYDGSLNFGTPWSWSDMVGDLWNRASTLLSSFGGLPTTPAGTPDNWVFPGVVLWCAICDVLEHLGLTTEVDLSKASTAIQYSVVESGGTDTDFDALTTRYSNRLEDDWQWIDVGSGRVPGTVVVCFRRRNEYYGTEETVRLDSWQWEMRPFYAAAPIAAPSTFAGAVGQHILWDDFQVCYDVDGNPLAADVATAATIAAERVRQYFDVIYSRTAGSMHRVYAGLIPFAAGAQVEGVAWRQDFRDDRRMGFITEIMRGKELWSWSRVFHGVRS